MFYIIDYFWRDGEFLKVGRIISPKSEGLEMEVKKLMKGERGSVTAIRGPYKTENDAQAASSPVLGFR